MLKRIIIPIILLIILLPVNLVCQKIHFSQAYGAPLFLSPSYTGMTHASRIILNYRDQWKTYTTYACSYDQYFSKIKSGIGLSFLRDEAGEGKLGVTDIGLSYSYKIKVNRNWVVRPGIKFKYTERKLFDPSGLLFGDQIVIGQEDIPLGQDYELIHGSAKYVDIDASVLAYHKYYWGGATVAHLLQPNPSIVNEVTVKIPFKYTLFGGATIPIKGDRRRRMEYTESVSFSLMYLLQDQSDQVSCGAYWYKAPFTLGLWARTVVGVPRQKKYTDIESIIVLIGFEVQDLKFGYSYDYTLSNLFGLTGGSHEVSIMYEFNKDGRIRPNPKRVTIPCPKF